MSAELLSVLCLVFVVSFGVVMLLATRRRSLDSLKIDIRPDEVEVDRLSLDGRFSRSRLLATTHRVILQEVRWLFARSRSVAIPVHDLDGARLEHRMDPTVLVIGILMFGMIAPIGVLLVIYALAATRYLLVFGSRNHRIRYSLPGTVAEGVAVTRFYRHVQRERERTRGAPTLATSILDPVPAVALRAVAPQAWLGVLVMMFAASVQRGILGGVDLGNMVFLVAYGAVPAFVGGRSTPRSGFLTGFFGMLGVVAVLFPVPLVDKWAMGPEAAPWTYLAAALVAGFVGAAAGIESLGAAAIATATVSVGWLLVAALADAASAWTIGLVASVLAAGAAAALSCGVGRSGRASADDVAPADDLGDALSEPPTLTASFDDAEAAR